MTDEKYIYLITFSHSETGLRNTQMYEKKERQAERQKGINRKRRGRRKRKRKSAIHIHDYQP